MNIYSSIKELPLKTFIHCSCYEDYTALCKTDKAQFSEEEKGVLSAAWMRLLSEYYATRGDAQAEDYIRIVAEMESIRIRGALVGFLLQCMAAMYTEAIAEHLRDLFKELKFTPQSYERDMTLCLNIERKHTARYNQLKLQFEQQQRERPAEESSGEDKERAFMNLLFNINNHEHSQYDESVSTYKFALLAKRLDDHIADLERQKLIS